LFHATRDVSLRSKIVIVSLVTIIIGALMWWAFSFYAHFTVAQPKRGGHYIEALVGQPRFINPLLSHSSSVDQSLSQLIYGSLFDYDDQGVLQNDLAERYELSEDAKEYTVHLRRDVLWHDGMQFTSDDVIHTIGTVKNIAYSAVGVNNEMRLFWQNVRIERIDEYTIKFILNEPNSMLLHSLRVGILPRHIWENISPEQFQLSEFNQKPIGTGPYQFLASDTDDNLFSAYILRANKMYYEGEPFITKFTLRFYATRDDAVAAYNNGEVSAVIVDKKEHVDMLHNKAFKQSIELPHYFGVFFNQTKSVALAYDEVREALSRATDRQAIIAAVFGDDAVVRYSPFTEGVKGYVAEAQQTGFDLEGANVLLEEKGWKMGDDGIRKRDNDRLAFVLHVSDNHEQFIKTAEQLREQWRAVGADVTIQQHAKEDLELNVIKPRDYDALLYAHQMRFEPNLLPLWHSSEKSDPGMNYAIFDDDEMDESLKLGVSSSKEEDRINAYKKQQERLKQEVPAVFLFAPKVSFMHSDAVKGVNIKKINSSYDRYTNVYKWYIKEKRVKK
jgi:peptide/nickel transport system substrate-binding protein